MTGATLESLLRQFVDERARQSEVHEDSDHVIQGGHERALSDRRIDAGPPERERHHGAERCGDKDDRGERASDHGREIAHGTADQLKDMIGGERIELTLQPDANVADAQRVLARFAVVRSTGRTVR